MVLAAIADGSLMAKRCWDKRSWGVTGRKGWGVRGAGRGV